MNEEALRALKEILEYFHREVMFSRKNVTALEMFLKNHKDQTLWKEYQTATKQVENLYCQAMVDRDPSKLDLLVPRSIEEKVPLLISTIMYASHLK